MKRKSYVIPTIYLLILFTITAGAYFTREYYTKEVDNYGNITFVSNSIFSRSIPIINIPDLIHNPYEISDITIARYYYNEEDNIDKKEKSIVYYDNTYMPNTGIDYTNEESFEIVSIMDGSVIEIKEDEVLQIFVKLPCVSMHTLFNFCVLTNKYKVISSKVIKQRCLSVVYQSEKLIHSCRHISCFYLLTLRKQQ